MTTGEQAEMDAKVDGQTVTTEFVKLVQAHPDLPALRWKGDDDTWQRADVRTYAAEVARYAAAFARLGVQRGDRIMLMLRNIPEFHFADMAAYFCGATPISIYNSSSTEQVEYLVTHAGAKVVIVEDEGFLSRFLPVRDRLETLEHLIVLKTDGRAPEGVLTGDELLSGDAEFDLEAGAAASHPDDVATVIYTSGTTGNPKGVVLTHRNVLWTGESLRRAIHRSEDELRGTRLLSYLPMAHIAERMTSHYMGAVLGYEITTCPDTNRLSEYLTETKPQIFFGVPRVWEKMQAVVAAALAADPEKKAQFDSGVQAAIPIVDANSWGRATDEQKGTYEFLDAVAFKLIREKLGLDEVEFAISGAAPIRPDLLEWFRAVGVPLSEIYGMSETSGPMTWAPVKVKAGTVGPAIPGTEVCLGEDGELLCRGGNIFQGYLDNEEQTAGALDAEGWLHTGDIAEIDDDGYVRIVDRKKELIITAGGKNVSPANLEAALKGIDLVAQACAIGDRRPFVGALVTLDPEVAPVWAKQNGIEDTSLEALAEHPKVVEAIQSQLDEVMAEFNNAERVKKVVVLSEEWLPDTDLLTPTSKLKRRGIHTRYAEQIEELYAR